MVQNTSTREWYKIQVPENGEVTITSTPKGELELYYTELYALDAENILRSRESKWIGKSEGAFTVKNCAKGTYYVVVRRGGGSGEYTVRYDFKATSAEYANDNEPNDSWEVAKSLPVATDVTGHLGYVYYNDTDTEDWFKIVVPENGEVTITSTPHGDLELYYTELYALDADNILRSRDSKWIGKNPGAFTVANCAKGTYYLVMRRSSGQGGYTVRYDFKATSSDYPDDNEPNNSWEEAKPLPMAKDVTGHFGYVYYNDMDTEDWFKLEVPENGEVTITSTPHGDIELYYTELFALDAENILRSRGSKWIGKEQGAFTVTNCAKGTYYLAMRRGGGQGGYTVRYDFKATSSEYPDDNEPNNSWEVAKPLPVATNVTGHFGYVYYNDMDTEDWFKIEVPGNGEVTITSTPHGDLELYYTELYALDAENNLRSRGSKWIGKEEGAFTVKSCAKGTYYLVMRRGGGQGGYTVRYDFKATSADYANDKEPNNSWQEAKLLKRGNTVTGHLGYYYYNDKDTEDWFKIEVPRNGTIQLNFEPHGDLTLYYQEVYALDSENVLRSRQSKWSGGNPGEIVIPDAAPGTYYVVMRHNGDQGSYSLKYQFIQNDYATDSEPNDSKDKAISLSSGVTVAGHLGYYYYDDRDTEDWYKLTVSAKGTVEFNLRPIDNLELYYVTLYDSNDRQKGSKWFGGNEGTITVENVDAGTYYLRVTRNAGYGTYFLCYNASISNVNTIDPLPDEPAYDPNDPDNPNEPNDPNNPNNPIIEGPDKDFINDVGKDLLNQWDADSYRNILELLQQAMSFNTEEISEWGANALGSVKTAITTPYNGISNGYMLMLRASLFTGHFKAVNDRWIYEGPADDLQFTYPDKAGTTCVARILTSGDTKTVSMPYEFDEDEDDDDDDNGILGKAKDLTNGVKVIAAEVPEHFEISFTHGNTQLMLTTIDFDLSCFTDNWSPTTNGLIVSINSTFAKSNSGVRRRGGPGTFELSMNRVGYQPVTGISFSFAAKNDGKQIMSLDVKAPGTINVDNGLIDIDAEKGVTINDIGIESLKVDLDVMGRLQARGQIDDLPNFVNKAIKASNCEDEAEAKQIKGELDNMMQGNFYYDGNPEPKGSLGMGVTYDKDKGEWKLEPTISFKSDNSTYPIKTYFSEENFPEFVGGVKTIVSELVGVATTMREKVEKMNEEATNATTNPDDNKACLIVWRNETQKDYYVLEEKPKITMSNGDFILTTTNTTVTYKFEDVLKFTLSESTATAIEEVKAVAEPSVERTSEKVIFTGCTPKSAIRIYSIGGQLLDTQWADANGRAEVSISGLTAGVYVVKSDSVTIKIAKR